MMGRSAAVACSVLGAAMLLCQLAVATAFAASHAACGRGLGEPPFLSYGVDHNLLLLLDNSGSMLDLAYAKDILPSTTNAPADRVCFDDSFHSYNSSNTNSVSYAGNFELLIPVAPPAVPSEVAWYKWVEGIQQWEHKEYAEDALVYANGAIYRAQEVSGAASSGKYLEADPEVVWELLLRPYWRASTHYPANALVLDQVTGHVYFSETGGTSSAIATSPAEDTGIAWVRVRTWTNTTNYAKGDLVQWKNRIYRAQNAASSLGDSPVNDRNVPWQEVDPYLWQPKETYQADDVITFQGMVFRAKTAHTASGATIFEDNFAANWVRIDEGYYEMMTAAAAQAACTGARGGTSVYSSPDMCIALDEADSSDTTRASKMLAFAASGNALNWLMSSKFDIEKSILTGGKFEPQAERLISEGRGCSGSRFVKQLDVQKDGVSHKLTLAVRGSRSEGEPHLIDRIDSTDDTTRIEVLAVTAGGYDADVCQAAVTRITEHGLNGSQSWVDNCLTGLNKPAKDDPASKAHSALNHALQYCWQTDRNMNTIVSDCADVYKHLPAASIPTFHRAYNCSGLYDQYLPHTERAGYMGRCWSPVSSATGSTCDPAKITNPASCSGYPCEFIQNSDLLRNQSADASTTQVCTKLKNGKCQNQRAWTTYYTDSVSGLGCNPKDYGKSTEVGGNWSSEIDGEPVETPAPDSAPYDPDNNVKLADAAYFCVKAAMDDYCFDLTVPQVIDSSDQSLSTSSEVGNIPAQLVDSGVMTQLGVDRPIFVMKGYIKHVDPPEGLLQQNAENLRVGAMAFSPVGAATECTEATINDRIEQYCLAGDQDGARVIAPIRSGMMLSGQGVTRHIDTVVKAVNRTRATTWTPLAEAMYNAIGYYTQNKELRLHDSDFMTDADVLAGWKANTFYAPGSYVLVEGALWQNSIGGNSSATAADITGDTALGWAQVGGYQGAWTNNNSYSARTIVQHNSKFYLTLSGGTSHLKADAVDANKTGPHFDEGVTWEPLFDPVVYSCQENHILVLTEGASTADINAQVKSFVNGNALTNNEAIIDDDKDTRGRCEDGLLGSSLLDNLTYFAHDPDDKYGLYPEGNATTPVSDAPFDEHIKNNLTTHVVVTGSLRDTNTADECNPAVLMRQAALNGGTERPVLGESPAQLEQQLRAIFNELRQRASAGSAASVISSARGGEGAIYQAVFWPELVRQDSQGANWSVSWAGDVHGLFLDDNGFMYEDTDFNRTMNPGQDSNGDGTIDVVGDRRVVVYFDQELKKTMACYNTSILELGSTKCTDAKDLMDVRFLWSASDWLSDYPLNAAGTRTLNALDTKANRSNHISKARQRYIFTWSDKNHDGVVDYGGDEVMDLTVSTGGTAWNALANNFGASNGIEVNNIISWLRGDDWLVDEDPNGNGIIDAGEPGDTVSGDGPLRRPMRSRQSTFTNGDSSFSFTWRLGDVIHSTPVTVGTPMEGYHQLYNDVSYAAFLAKYKGRRQMLYFGANDGMLHAVNGGFYSDVEKKFCMVELDSNGKCPNNDHVGDVPDLGAELWAYVPYNLQPHLKCLTSPLYAHKYFVDLKPRAFDAQIFSPSEDHPNGWGTILVGGMRFGGAPISTKELNTADTSNRQFISAYFILDITNPEKKPVLLAEMTQKLDANGTPEYANLGYTTVTPTMVVAKGGSNLEQVNKWYLVFGSGPHGKDAMKGVSDQQARVSVFPLGGVVNNTLVDGLVDTNNRPIRAMRIAKGHPVAESLSGGTFLLPGTEAADAEIKGFTSDLITVDFDIKSARAGSYASDVVYFGTVEGAFGKYPDGSDFWNGGGHLYRLVMNEEGHDLRKNGIEFFDPSKWAVKPMLNLSGSYTVSGSGVTSQPKVPGNAVQPITAAPAVGFDGDNYWIYFGTGRFFDPDDKTDRQQQGFYGLKEPVITQKITTGSGKNAVTTTQWILNWEAIEFNGLNNISGQKGLLQTDQIVVPESMSRDVKLSCRDGSKKCFPTNMDQTDPTFDKLEQYIAGRGTCSTAPDTLGYNRNCVDGWYANFFPYGNRERNVGQAALLGGLTTFATYQPYNDVCLAEGNGFLYALYYRTGTAWRENVFGDTAGLESLTHGTFVRSKMGLGRGLSTTPNLHTGGGLQGGDGVKAFAQTSTGEIKEIKQENLPIKNYRSGKGRWKVFERPQS
ncbi:MAG: hypothetical protein GX087_05955 [Desulfobulbaceae bacterium]|nr:hypothetical protein [Desulfobulbaceae bacterium]